MTRPPFPAVVDSTMISAFRACPQKFFREYIEHWRPKVLSVHLHAGAAYATGLEALRLAFFRDHLPAGEALAAGLHALAKAYGSFECPDDSPKSLARMLGALEFYAEAYPLEDEAATPVQIGPDRLGIEFSFVEPLDVSHPETGDPILYCGRMDQVVNFAGGQFGEDDKTTSSLGASWSKQWDLRSQFTGYCWGCAKAGIPLQGFLVRGVSILKTKYDTQQALTYRPPWMIDRWYEQLLRDIARMKQCWEAGLWDYDLSEACESYGGCTFRKVCLSPDPVPWLETDFERRRWDPVRREEIKVE
jgi:PD-(D/E)XK nuclease superfamily